MLHAEMAKIWKCKNVGSWSAFWEGVLQGLSGPALMAVGPSHKFHVQIQDSDTDQSRSRCTFDNALRSHMVTFHYQMDMVMADRGLEFREVPELRLDKDGKFRQLARKRVGKRLYVQNSEQSPA